jgi:glyoxylase-like metal-dependent hydrolase (beta-lactamase superfamily II)
MAHYRTGKIPGNQITIPQRGPMKKILIIAGAIVLVVVVVAVFLGWQGFRNFMAVETVQPDPQLKILLGGGGNSIVLTSEDGLHALVVDTKMASAAKTLKSMVTAGDVTIVNTHFHADHTGGNTLYPGAKVIAGSYTQEQWNNGAGKNRYPDETVKPGEEKVLQIGSETVHVRNMGRAHTWNDVVVYLGKRKLLATGDIIFLDRHPVLFAGSGANVASWTAVLDSLQTLYDVTTLVPGHGKVSDKGAIAWMKEYFTSARNAIGDPQKQAALKEKYKNLFSLPGMSGLEKTMGFIEKERTGAGK